MDEFDTFTLTASFPTQNAATNFAKAFTDLRDAEESDYEAWEDPRVVPTPATNTFDVTAVLNDTPEFDPEFLNILAAQTNTTITVNEWHSTDGENGINRYFGPEAPAITTHDNLQRIHCLLDQLTDCIPDLTPETLHALCHETLTNADIAVLKAIVAAL